MSKTLTELTTLNKHPFIQNIRKVAQNGHNSFNNAVNLAATDTYGDKKVAKSHPAWGSISGVFSDKNSVLKVYHDPAYHEFVNYAKAHQDDPHMPKIYSHVRTPDGIGLVRMEKLKDIRDGNTYENGVATHNSHFSEGGVFEPYNEELWNARSGLTLHGLLHDVPGSSMRKHQPSFHKSLSNLSLHFAHKDFDLHPGNIMQRANGTPVITDPLWDQHHWSKKNDAKKLLSGLDEMMTLNRHPVMHTLSGTDYNPVHKIRDAVMGRYNTNDKSPEADHLLGRGMFGAVYKHPKNEDTVIKVFQDKGYHEYINWAKQNQDNPHVPKIYAYKKLNHHGLGVVKMERLHPLSVDNAADAHYITHANSYLRHETGQRILDTMDDAEDFGAFLPSSYFNTIHKLASTYPHRKFDLHSQNLMKRYETTPQGFRKTHIVITDPFAEQNLDEMMTLNKHPLGSKLGDLPDEIGRTGYRLDPGTTLRKAIARHYSTGHPVLTDPFANAD